MKKQFTSVVEMVESTGVSKKFVRDLKKTIAKKKERWSVRKHDPFGWCLLCNNKFKFIVLSRALARRIARALNGEGK